jgi:two-component system sensor histidine kinase KdpD
VLAYARDNNVTQIVLGKPARPRWRDRLFGSILQDFTRKAGLVGLHIVAGEGGALPAKTVRTRAAPAPFDPTPYFVATLVVAFATAVGWVIEQQVVLPNISLLFLAAILFSAIRHGLGPSLFASFVSVLAYNFFFIPPLYTFTIADPANVLALVFFTAVAVLTSNLTALLRRQALIARHQVKTTAELNAFSRKLAGIGKLDDLLWAASFQIASMLKLRVIFLFPEDDRMGVAAGYPPEDGADEADLAAARWCWDHKASTGRGSDTLSGAKRLFLPLRTQSGLVGVVGLDRDAPGPLFTPDERRLLDGLLDQIAVSIERTRLADDLDDVRLEAETERMRSALLASISHDLRTPLAAILGSITSLRRRGPHLDAAGEEELKATIEEEAERLNRFVGNLLDMTRLESGALKVKAERVDLVEVVETTLRRAKRVLARRRVELDIPPELPMLAVDAVLFEQVLFNLLDNAAKHAPEGSLIRIVAAPAERGRVRIEVSDEGEGIPPEHLEAIFDKFHRVKEGDQRPAGTGLGLAVCRGFLEAYGGRISAANRRDRPGAVFTLLLPAQSEDALPAERALPF